MDNETQLSGSAGHCADASAYREQDVGETSLPGATAASDQADLIQRVGTLTRTLHDSLRALGYDKDVEAAANAIPDARDRLAYVVNMTQQAADRTLNAIEVLKPLQDELGGGAARLVQRWDQLYARELDVARFKVLADETREYLRNVPAQTRLTNTHLTEIMMAQDFQDLTGQVIKKTTAIIQMVETELLKLLYDSVPRERRVEVSSSLLNGPQIKVGEDGSAVTNQTQVDDLLESLGF